MLSQDNNNSYSDNGLNNKIREEENYPFTSPYFLDNNKANRINKNNELIFNADFESGNLDSVQKYSYCEYDLYIRPDPSANNNRQGHRVWFYFQIKNTEKNQRVILNIVNFSKAKMALYRQGATPVVKSDKRPEWVRLPKDTVFLHRSNRHKKNYVLSIAFCFDDPDDTYYFAFSFPYTYTQLQNYLKNLEERNLPFLKRSFIGYSVEKKRLDLLTISNIENFNKPGKKKTVCITSRVHPGESPSSYVCEGLIDFLVSNDPIAKILRDNLIFKIIPCLNPDGVYHGNYRTCTLGYDLNRNWLK
ncbi:hypothetical protein PIROE2DRAFT_2661 [Piromyces sp. E2]|nr:hypothetical protein PIROE2DRAFT_2661 [Piromyces sp. E2]|eukprot:OUM69367.1 hypothetical protein PIROE2DRAFT_2661 [Piromyces sp. E2]